MSDSSDLSRRERQIMEIVFALGEATLTEILERVENPPTRPALRSIIGILETKGRLAQGMPPPRFATNTGRPIARWRAAIPTPPFVATDLRGRRP